MAYTFDENIVSDLHKDAYGCRPGEFFWEAWNLASDDSKQIIWDNLCRALADSIQEEQDFQAASLTKFDELVETTMKAGAPDMLTAMRWILDAEGLDNMDYCYGADYCAYHFGLSYDNPYKALFEQVCREKADWDLQFE